MNFKNGVPYNACANVTPGKLELTDVGEKQSSNTELGVKVGALAAVELPSEERPLSESEKRNRMRKVQAERSQSLQAAISRREAEVQAQRTVSVREG